MKIYYCIRPNYQNGGDGIQAIKTKYYIEKQYSDVDIRIITSPEELEQDADIVHIFNYATIELTNSFFEKAISLGLKIVSSPVYWDYQYSNTPFPLLIRFTKDFIDEKYVLRHVRINKILSNLPYNFLGKFSKNALKVKSIYEKTSRTFSRSLNCFIRNSALILPNSIEEGELCCDFAKANDCKKNIRVILNGVDINGITILEKELFFSKYKIPEKYILQVGRVEYLKNQLNLISSLMDHPEIPIVILGNNKVNKSYFLKLKELGDCRGNVFFISDVPHDEVYSFYFYAQTHVLLSMRESPGLVSIEALSQNCPIVVADKRCLPVKTYFGKQCESVNPFDKDAIEAAILRSYQKPHIPVDLSRFSWDSIAQATYSVYKELV